MRTKPEELINKIINGEAPIYHASANEKVADDSGQKEGFGRQIYKHMMNGVSHMLPFVVAGGIFIALAFLIDTAAGVNAHEAGTDFGTVTPFAAWMKTIGNYAFNFISDVHLQHLPVTFRQASSAHCLQVLSVVTLHSDLKSSATNFLRLLKASSRY